MALRRDSAHARLPSPLGRVQGRAPPPFPARAAGGACAVLAAPPSVPSAVRAVGKMALGCRQGCRLRSPVRFRRRPFAAQGLEAGPPARPYAAAGDEAASGQEELLLEVCRRRHFLRGDPEPRAQSAQLRFGPLGVALRGNLAALWWDAVLARREQVFAVDSPLHGCPSAGAPQTQGALRLLHSETLREALQSGGCSREPGGAALQEALGSAGVLRESLLPGTSLGTATSARGRGGAPESSGCPSRSQLPSEERVLCLWQCAGRVSLLPSVRGPVEEPSSNVSVRFTLCPAMRG